VIDRFVQEWRIAHGDKPLPRMGISRHIYVAETDARAEAEARPAYAEWYASLAKLWRAYHANPAHAPENFEVARQRESIIVGSPDTVAAELIRHIEISGANYFVGQMFFGNLTHEQMSRSLKLFASGVMPKLRPIGSDAKPA
jgi:alkanesulfonate monooxygenase SsuD/methylene tetrahydromethanopterin reductase-like flavin-dependent oxidoreductase (luciferase family)